MKSNAVKRKQDLPAEETDIEPGKAVWYDSDDEISDIKGLRIRYPKREGKPDAQYRQRLIEGFQLVHGIPAWSIQKKKRRMSENEDSDMEDDTTMFKGDTNHLRPGQIKIIKVKNLNNEGHNQKEFIRSIEFHPKSQVGLVAGSTDIVSLYQVDGSTNAKIQSVNFDHFSLHDATFSADGLEFYVSSPSQRHFYTYDMLSGKITQINPTYTTRHETIRKIIKSPDNKILVSLGHHGNMYLHTRHSKEMIATLKMNGEVQDITFNPSGSRMFSTGTLGEVYEWDMENRVCISKFPDDGAVMGSTMTATSKFLATGSSSGVVNVYDLDTISGNNVPKPIKSFMNLTTRVTSLESNHSGELLAFGSYEKRDVIKLAHIPSMTVYSNFPFVNTFWGRPNTVAFSPNSGYFSFGNDRGEAYLFRLKHFENY